MNIETITLADVYKKNKTDRDIFQELMPYKVKEVLLIATLYDAYATVKEGQFGDKIFGEYLQLNLYAAPRFTAVNSMNDAINTLKNKEFDLIIVMAGVDKDSPLLTARELHNLKSKIPVLLLVNNNSDLQYFQMEGRKLDFIDRIFVWNGNSNVFLAMIKYIEDKNNVEDDTQNGNVRVILLVEDSIQYYSRYLPVLYTTIMTQTQILIKEQTSDELHKILKMRARPKVILVSTFEKAVEIINRYKNYLLCVISDVKFERNGVLDEDAGVELLKYTKASLKYSIPLLLQSHEIVNAERARLVKADFINKNSESLSMDILNFLYRRLGFGNFIFKGQDRKPLAEVENLQQFQEKFAEIPAEALLYHGRRNSFSTWLMARGEINMAELLRPIQTEDFKSAEELREFCLNVFRTVKFERLKGTIVNFDPLLVNSNRFVVRMSLGSLGGKGRGVAFISNFIENIDFHKLIPGLNIRVPVTTVLGALEFDKFIEINNLYEDIYALDDYESIRRHFLDAQFDPAIKAQLKEYLAVIQKPLAVRSSGLFEDSLIQPFSGVYETYLIPNNHPDINVRYEQLETAIKLVYASIFTDTAKDYFEAVQYKIEEERMAVIIQELVGNEYNGKYYPSFSGVAHSYNYYPVSYMKPEDGFTVMAVGLGMYVVGGENSFRFCPAYPKINPTSVQDQLRDTQRHFYAVDLTNPNPDLITEGELAAVKNYRIREAEADGTLTHLASTYEAESDQLIPGINSKGPRVIDFVNIVKYDKIPLAKTLQLLLRLFREAMGSPVEIEYSVDLEPGDNGLPTFYLLQIKPLIRVDGEVQFDLNDVPHKDILLYAVRGMGNGKIEHIRDVVYIEPDSFDKLLTKQMAHEINEINHEFEKEGKEYILIGPGRWGSRDHFTGIPVQWAQISKARVIVEMGLKNFNLEPSLGSHFFHNVTSKNVGYFSVNWNSDESFINPELFKNQQVIKKSHFITHIHFDQPLVIFMNGRERKILIHVQNDEETDVTN